MRVYFVGAGPGAPDLVTLRGARLLSRVPMILLADSLVNPGLLEHCRPDAQIFDASGLGPEEEEACYALAQMEDCDVARLHSGDPALYGALERTMRLLERLGIEYEIVPGVSSFTTAAAALGVELTQTVVLLRTTEAGLGEMPEGDPLPTLAVFLSGPHLVKLVGDLKRRCPPETPVALVRAASWPEQRVWRGTLARVLAENEARDWAVASLMLVGVAIGGR